MKTKTMFAISKVSGAILGLAVAAWLVAAQLVSPAALQPWRSAWLLLCSIGVAVAVLPLALVHAGLAAWADETIEHIDGLQKSRKR